MAHEWALETPDQCYLTVIYVTDLLIRLVFEM